jgi:cell division protein FtsI (penicillin-binding protein 3)
MSKGFASNYRIVLLSAAILASFTGLGVRLVCLHVVDRDNLMRFVAKARRQIITEHARRGDILDRNGAMLATSTTLVQLGVDPQALRPEDEVKWPRLAELLGQPLETVRAVLTKKTTKLNVSVPAAASGTGVRVSAADEPAIAAVASATANPSSDLKFVFDLASSPAAPTKAEGSDAAGESDRGDEGVVFEDDAENGVRRIRWATLSDRIDEDVYEKVMALGIRGVYGNRAYARAYPHNQLAAHVLGYVNKSGVPAAGVESYADFFLRGQDGWREGERDGRGHEAAQFRTRDVPAHDGYTVVLSLDTVVQHYVEEELETIAKKYQPEKATIIVSDARTGFILALGNYPTFNLNEYYNVAPKDQGIMRNVAVTDQLDPGSTFKIVAASGALADGLVQSTTTFDCMQPSMDYKGKPRRFMPDEHHFDHRLTVAEIIAHSSNNGAAQLGMLLGEQKLYGYARRFGFGERTGFPFGGEISGLLNPPEKWSDVDITRISAGYSVSATPMQIHYAMGVIASGGLLLRPQIIREVRDSSGEIVYRFDMVSKWRVIPEKTADEMARMLMGVASPGGTAPGAAINNFQVAGKTGTAQKLINGHYSNHNHVGSFVGFFPASSPRVVISVIVDDAKLPGGAAGYGATVAAPSFKRLGEQLIPYLGITPVYDVPHRGPALLALEGGRR